MKIIFVLQAVLLCLQPGIVDLRPPQKYEAGTLLSAAISAEINRSSNQSRVWPIDSKILRRYEPPLHDWLPGHRGIDIAAEAGQVVRAPESGVVSWTGRIAGIPMMTIAHSGGIRTTYQPVTALLPTGSTVNPGELIGVVEFMGTDYEHDGLHFGVKRGEQYLNPEIWLAGKTLPQTRLYGNRRINH